MGYMSGTASRSRRGLATLALVVGAGALTALGTAVAHAATNGELTQKPGTAACISDTGTSGECQDGQALDQAEGVAVSPDGKSVYVASFAGDSVSIFDRD